jgi:nucleotide-binding universal stress UspA family protein
MKILIGYDGSAGSEAALDDLQRAGLPTAAEAFVLSVAEVWLPPPAPSAFELVEGKEVRTTSANTYKRANQVLQQARERVEQARARLQANNPDWIIRSEASYGSPAWELVAKADEWKPDLIVVGSHGHSALGRFVLGSVSHRVVTEARCSVRVARGRVEEPGAPIRLIVGLDGSAGSYLALQEVARRRWPAGSEIRLIVADDPLVPSAVGKLIPPLAEILEETNEYDRDWAEKMLDRSADVLGSSGLKIKKELIYGDPKQVLINTAEEWRADCIFVGSTGFSNRFDRFVLGSVSAAVVVRAHCSVEVVRSQK